MELGYHNHLLRTVPDAMHTVKVVVEHIVHLIAGKEDSVKVRQAEIELQRFDLAPMDPLISKKKSLPKAPFCLDKAQIKLANCRACNVICPQHIDFVPQAFFSNCYFKSHD